MTVTKKAVECIETNQTVMDKLAEHLIEKETITGKEFVAIYEEITGEKLKEAARKNRKKKQKNSRRMRKSNGLRIVSAGC